jgi:hypothetical protein
MTTRDTVRISRRERNLAKLPETSAAIHPGSGTTIVIERGVPGFYPAPSGISATDYNAAHGVTPSQASAMLVGSMYGWDAPGADPSFHG